MSPLFPVLATVRHSATHFGFHILGQHYCRTEIRAESKRPFYFTHTEPKFMGDVRARLENGSPLISTMRHPMRVAESWIKRGKPLDNVFIRMWADLFSLHDEYSDSFWLPVDTDDKQERLDLISERLGVEFKTRWEVFGHHDKYQGEYSEGMTLDEVRQLFKPDWFDQFGYEL